MAATSKLKIVFEMDDEKTHTISLLDPKENLSRTDVVTCGNLIISKEAIVKNNASPVSVKDAYIDKSERLELSA